MPDADNDTSISEREYLKTEYTQDRYWIVVSKMSRQGLVRVRRIPGAETELILSLFYQKSFCKLPFSSGKMKKILLNTVCSLLTATLGFGLPLLIFESGKGSSPIILLLIMGNSILPTFLAVLLYYFLVKKIRLKSPGLTFLLRVLSSMLLYSLALIICNYIHRQ